MASEPSNTNTKPTVYIYKIAPGSPSMPIDNHAELPASFILPSSDLDIQSGFLHMSTAKQIPGTLRHFFSSSRDSKKSIYLLRVEYSLLKELEAAPDALIEVRWESPDASICGPREGEGMFPHIYLKDARKSGTKGESAALATLGGKWFSAGQSEVVPVDSVVELTSETNEEGWESSLGKVKGWLV